MTRAAMQARITELEQMVKTLSETVAVLLRNAPPLFTPPFTPLPAQPIIYPQPSFPPYTSYCGDPIPIPTGGITTCDGGINAQGGLCEIRSNLAKAD